MAMKENNIKVYDYVKENGDSNITAADIAEATGLEVRSVNGIVTAAFQRHTGRKSSTTINGKSSS